MTQKRHLAQIGGEVPARRRLAVIFGQPSLAQALGDGSYDFRRIEPQWMQIGFYRAPEGQELRKGAGFGQDGSRSYEERQRIPGDYDA